MFPLMFVAIAAGLGTAAAVAPTSVALAVITAPFGGSLAALATAFYLARRNDAAGERRPADLRDRTDSMVAALRGLEAQGRAEPHRSHRRRASGKAGPGRHVA
ncbi:hypothetical protein FV218_00895 [Methylobacterium sp. WL69]|uniref:hypothetical protein n=1 Tax=Methylobacterium sp. WL69 TaxID=2603893 RepID=UPI0011C8BEC8|nr:hypothetical protein [Methylobacterium sp. WL69]TXM79048.1 hypothetical protein FV218_00895 [Methylobacterium sp. WL69]